MEKLSWTATKLRAKALPHWQIKRGKLFRMFRFKTFNAAFGFMTQSALMIEKMNHHPEWTNSYNEVTVSLATHSVKGLTDLDFKLAETLEKLAKPLLNH